MKKISKLLKGFSRSGKKGVAWLVDPEKRDRLDQFDWIQHSGLDLILIGGSGGDGVALSEAIRAIRVFSGEIPLCIFPGSKLQLSDEADGILFLSLISGNNPEYLIGQQVEAAATLEEMSLEILPTGYILVNDGEIRSVHEVSKTLPILNSNLGQLKSVALAGKYLGMNYFYLEAGSGATNPVAPKAIQTVKKSVGSPLFVGGGLNSPERVKAAFDAGADVVVLGNGVENDPSLLAEALKIKRWYNQLLNIN